MATIRQKLSTYAITLVAAERQRLFQRTANAELFIATLFRYRDSGKFQLHAFVVMPDHVHVLITPAIDQSTSRCIQLIKAVTLTQFASNIAEKSGIPGITITVFVTRKILRRSGSTSRIIRRVKSYSIIRTCIRMQSMRR